MRDQHQNQMLRQSQMMPGQFNVRAVRGGMNPANLQRTALQNNSQNLYVFVTPVSLPFLRFSAYSLFRQDSTSVGAITRKPTGPDDPASDAARAL